MKTKFAWFPVSTDKGIRWLEEVGIEYEYEWREIYPPYPGDWSPPEELFAVVRYKCLRS